MLGFAALPRARGRAGLEQRSDDDCRRADPGWLCAAVLGVLVPLSLADISRGTGRFNLAQGIVGSATGIGAALSTRWRAILPHRFGDIRWRSPGSPHWLSWRFLAVLLAMPETRPGLNGKRPLTERNSERTPIAVSHAGKATAKLTGRSRHGDHG